jgi:hypothetical protein
MSWPAAAHRRAPPAAGSPAWVVADTEMADDGIRRQGSSLPSKAPSRRMRWPRHPPPRIPMTMR